MPGRIGGFRMIPPVRPADHKPWLFAHANTAPIATL